MWGFLFKDMGYFSKTQKQKDYYRLDKEYEEFLKKYRTVNTMISRGRYGRNRPVEFVPAPEAILLGWESKLYFTHNMSEEQKELYDMILALFPQHRLVTSAKVVRLSRGLNHNYVKLVKSLNNMKKNKDTENYHLFIGEDIQGIPRLSKSFHEYQYIKFPEEVKKYFTKVYELVYNKVYTVYYLNEYFPLDLLKIRLKKVISLEVGMLDREYERNDSKYRDFLDAYNYIIPKDRNMCNYYSWYEKHFSKRAARRSRKMIIKELVKYPKLTYEDVSYEGFWKQPGSSHVKKAYAIY